MKYKQNEYFKNCRKRHTVWFEFKLTNNSFVLDQKGTRITAYGNEKFTRWIEDKLRHKLADILTKNRSRKISLNDFKKEYYNFFIELINSNPGLNPVDIIWFLMESYTWLMVLHLDKNNTIDLSINSLKQFEIQTIDPRKQRPEFIEESLMEILNHLVDIKDQENL